MLLAVPAVGVCVVVTPDVVFGLPPVWLLVTLKVTVQLPDAGIPMPVKLNAVWPAVNDEGVVPVQVPPTAPATALIFVSVSVNAPPVSADALLLVSVRVTTEVPAGDDRSRVERLGDGRGRDDVPSRSPYCWPCPRWGSAWWSRPMWCSDSRPCDCW